MILKSLINKNSYIRPIANNCLTILCEKIKKREIVSANYFKYRSYTNLLYLYFKIKETKKNYKYTGIFNLSNVIIILVPFNNIL